MENLTPDRSCEITDLACHVGNFFDWLKSFWEWLFRSILDVGIAVLSYIPVPSFMQNIGSMSIDQNVLWVVNVFQLDFAAGVMATSLIVRFTIRRVPFIG